MLDDHAPERLRADVQDLVGHHLGVPDDEAGFALHLHFLAARQRVARMEGRQADHETGMGSGLTN